MTAPDPPDDATQRRGAEKRAAGYQKKQAAATREKGLLIVYTGSGKGKSTAAFGMGLRAIGHGMKLGVVQFIKGAMASAERDVLKGFPNVDFQTAGAGFTWLTQNRAQDIATAEQGWRHAERMIQDSDYAMVILDELNVVLKYGYLDLPRVLRVLGNRREGLHIVVTGRHAPPELIALADLASDIRSIKHPYKDQGVKAQKGVEF